MLIEDNTKNKAYAYLRMAEFLISVSHIAKENDLKSIADTYRETAIDYAIKSAQIYYEKDAPEPDRSIIHRKSVGVLLRVDELGWAKTILESGLSGNNPVLNTHLSSAPSFNYLQDKLQEKIDEFNKPFYVNAENK